MKKALSILLFLPLAVLSQKIRINEYDKFIKQQRVESFPLSIANAPDMKLSVCFTAIGPNLYVQLIGAGIGAHRIEEGDPVIFLLDNDSTVTVKSKASQSFEIGTTISTYKHHYVFTYTDLQKLSQFKLAALRKYHSEEFHDVSVPKEVGEKFKTLSALFLVELVNSNLLHLVQANEPKKAAIQTKPVPVAQLQPTDTVAKVNTIATGGGKAEPPKKPEIKVLAPAFPGGVAAWSGFLRNTLFPQVSLEEGEALEALVEFLVKADGSVTNIKILQSAGPAFDKEVLWVLKRSPKWEPSTENGKPVAATVTQRIVFVSKERVVAN